MAINCLGRGVGGGGRSRMTLGAMSGGSQREAGRENQRRRNLISGTKKIIYWPPTHSKQNPNSNLFQRFRTVMLKSCESVANANFQTNMLSAYAKMLVPASNGSNNSQKTIPQHPHEPLQRPQNPRQDLPESSEPANGPPDFRGAQTPKWSTKNHHSFK